MTYQTLDLILDVIAVALIICSASLHEFGHAWVAHLCGDDTAKEQGRLTPNPLAHIDPFGSVILPLILTFSGAGYMAFAKPVPYNPYRLRNRRRDEVLVAVAGPLANLLQAVVGAACFRACLWFVYHEIGDPFAAPYYLYDIFGGTPTGSPLAWLVLALQLYVQVNCSLAFFNLLPLPPLDGSKIIMPLLKGDALQWYYKVQHYALLITLALIWLLPRLTGLDPIGAWLDLTAGNLSQLLLGMAR
jgi:Zn-dependent protease